MTWAGRPLTLERSLGLGLGLGLGPAAFAVSSVCLTSIAWFRVWREKSKEERCLLARVGASLVRNVAGADASEWVETATGLVHFVRVDGGNKEDPHAPVLVLVHGLASSVADWVLFVAQLQRRKRAKEIILIDLPGHGLSPARIAPYSKTMDEIISIHCHAVRDCIAATTSATDNIVIIGNSMGGWVTHQVLQYLDEDEDEQLDHGASLRSVKGIVLLSPAGAPIDEEHIDNIRRLFRHKPGEMAETIVSSDSWVTRYAHFVLQALAPLRTLREACLHTLDVVKVGDGSTPENAAHTPVPVLFIWGEHEKLLSKSQLEWWRTHLPADRTDIKTPSALGHLPQVERPGLIADAVEEFLVKLGL